MQSDLPYIENSSDPQLVISNMAKNAVNIKDVVPGQSNQSIFAFVKNLQLVSNRSESSVLMRYAGFLGSTSPQQTDFADPEVQKAAYAVWFAACTPAQIIILNAASKRKKIFRRAADRKEYALAKFAETGEPVRAYAFDRSDEAKRALAAARQQRRRDKLKATGLPAPKAR